MKKKVAPPITFEIIHVKAVSNLSSSRSRFCSCFRFVIDSSVVCARCTCVVDSRFDRRLSIARTALYRA